MAATVRGGWAGGVPKLGRLSDERLAGLAGDGDTRAFALLYERYHQQLYRYCRSILLNESDAKDALQSTFASAFAALGRWRRDAPLRPWLFRIAHNEAINLIRRRSLDSDVPQAPELVAPSVEAQAAERARLSVLVADLLDLPERQRTALLMRELSGLSHEEIAETLGLSVATAKQTIFEARRSLSDCADGRATSCTEIRRTISDADGRKLRGKKVRAHLRDCVGCSAFAQEIPAREASLRALVPPLPAAAATGLLARMLGRSGTGQGGGSGGMAAGAVGKAASVVVPKAIAGLIIAAAATVGVTALVQQVAASPDHPALVHHPNASDRQTARAGRGGSAPSASQRSAQHAARPSAGSGGTAPVARIRSVPSAPGGTASTNGVTPVSGGSTGQAGDVVQTGGASNASGGNGLTTDGGGHGARGGNGYLGGHGGGGRGGSRGGAGDQNGGGGGVGQGQGYGAGGRRGAVGGPPGQLDSNGDGNWNGVSDDGDGANSASVGNGSTQDGGNGSAGGD
jgi:RNA polymerase sigma factor (sigma-70 family)